MDNPLTIEIREDTEGKITLFLVEWDMEIKLISNDHISGDPRFMKIFATNTAQAYKEYWRGIMTIKIKYVDLSKSEVIEYG